MDDQRTDPLYHQSTGSANPEFYEKIVGKDNMSRLFEAKELIEEIKAQERHAVNTFGCAKWTQDADEVVVTVPLPGTFSGSKKDIKVVIKSLLIAVDHLGTCLLSCTLSRQVDTDESSWHIDGKDIVFTLAKSQVGQRWEALGR